MRANRIDGFIRRWHAGEWSIATLPQELGATVGYVSFGGQIWGCCDVRRDGPSIIALDAALIGTPYHAPVLAHECAHILLGEPGYHACGTERHAWALAARLCVPEAICQSIRDGATTSDDVARAYGFPSAFVAYVAHGARLLTSWLEELAIP